MLKKRLLVTQIGSGYGRKPGHKASLIGLGLRRRHHTKELEDTPIVRGMIRKIAYLLKVEEL